MGHYITNHIVSTLFLWFSLRSFVGGICKKKQQQFRSDKLTTEAWSFSQYGIPEIWYGTELLGVRPDVAFSVVRSVVVLLIRNPKKSSCFQTTGGPPLVGWEGWDVFKTKNF